MDENQTADEKPQMNRIPAHGNRRMTRGMEQVPASSFQSSEGHRFGRMFPLSRTTPAWGHTIPDEIALDFLTTMGEQGGFLDEVGGRPGDVGESQIPAGFTFLGQFIDHDLTLDTTSSLERQNDPAAIQNFRTPNLELDSVYGSGPSVDSFLYKGVRGGNRTELAVGTDKNENDLPRTRDGTAIIGDPRNDENVMVSQLHRAFLRFHNEVVKEEEALAGNVFQRAQQKVRWHYQWIILNEFLPTICAPEVVDAVLENGRKFFRPERSRGSYMPIEFSGAAYRFGHSMVKGGYFVNEGFGAGLFSSQHDSEIIEGVEEPGDLRGFRPVDSNHTVQWDQFFKFESSPPSRPPDDGENRKPTRRSNKARKIDPRVSTPLFQLPFPSENIPGARSLAARNLRRGYTMRLPAGQTIARRMKKRKGLGHDITVHPNEDLVVGDKSFEQFLDEQRAKTQLPSDLGAPLWFYVLAEAAIEKDGEKLGNLGSRIVAEVIIGMLETDSQSYLNTEPGWTPTLPCEKDDEFTMVDLLKFAGVHEE